MRVVGVFHGLVVASCCTLPITSHCDESAQPSPLQDSCVVVEGLSLALPDAIKRSAANPVAAKCRALRADDDGTSNYQRRLARWCAKHDFAGEAALHWKLLLEMEPGDSEAIKALMLRKYQGAYLTADEIDAAKQDEKQKLAAERLWAPKLKRLKREIEHGRSEDREAAPRALRQIRDPLAISVMTKVFDIPSAAVSAALIQSLQRMPQKEATIMLARLGVQANDGNVIESAAAALRSRPLNDYVPLLVGVLATPIELQVDATIVPGEAEYQSYTAYSYTGRMIPGMYNKKRSSGNYTAADVAYWGTEATRTSGIAVTGFRPQRVEYSYLLTQEGPEAESSRQVSGALNAFYSIESIRAEIERANQASATLNEKVGRVLSRATQADLNQGRLQVSVEQDSVDPQLWWDWWKRTLVVNRYLAAGTTVVSSVGNVPIEQIMVGDRVLSRDPEGHLEFQLVVEVNRQSAGKMRRLEIDGRTIVASDAQTFATANSEWSKACDLQDGSSIESLAGPQMIDHVSEDEAVDQYTLFVESNGNYFIDLIGVQVQCGALR